MRDNKKGALNCTKMRYGEGRVRPANNDCIACHDRPGAKCFL